MSTRNKADDIHRTPDVTHIQNEDVSHEESDVDAKSVAGFGGGLLFFIIISMVLMYLLSMFFKSQAAKQESRRVISPLAAEEYNKLPPEPRLQNAEGWGVTLDDGKFIDLSKEYTLPDRERVVLQEYWKDQLKGGKVDANTGFTTLPIDQAMKETVAQGLSVRQGAQPENRREVPTDSSAGRVFAKKDK